MRMNRRLGVCLLAASLGLAAAPAWADDDCDVPVERWQSRDAVTQLARQKGWDLARIKIDDGCYEIRGEDEQGRSFKARLDPETLDVIKMKYGDSKRREHRRRDRPTRDSDSVVPGAAPAPTTGQSSRAISVGGAQIE